MSNSLVRIPEADSLPSLEDESRGVAKAEGVVPGFRGFWKLGGQLREELLER